MASRKTKVVDGFTAIRAAQEAARHGRGDPLRPESTPSSATKSTGDPKAGTRIGRSVMPSKREVICPECGVTSSVTGKVDLWVCTQCRHRMKLQDLELATGDWSDELEVGGTVIVPEGTRLTGGKIVANDIILMGHMDGAELRACRQCTIGASAKVDWVRLKAMDLEVGAGVTLTPGKPIQGRNLSLHGKFSGTAVLTGRLTIHADGDFSGQLRAAGLQVDEGGGFRAQLDVNPANAPPPVEPKKRVPAKTPTKLRSPPPQARPTPPRKQGGK